MILLKDKKRNSWWIEKDDGTYFCRPFGSFVVHYINNIEYMRNVSDTNFKKWCFENPETPKEQQQKLYDEAHAHLIDMPTRYMIIRDYLLRKNQLAISERFSIFKHFCMFAFVVEAGVWEINFDHYEETEPYAKSIEKSIKYCGYIDMGGEVFDGFIINVDNNYDLYCFYADLAEYLLNDDTLTIRQCPCGSLFVPVHGKSKFCTNCGKSEKNKLYTKRRDSGIRGKHQKIQVYLSRHDEYGEDTEKNVFTQKSNRYWSEVKKGKKSKEQYSEWLDKQENKYKKKYSRI